VVEGGCERGAGREGMCVGKWRKKCVQIHSIMNFVVTNEKKKKKKKETNKSKKAKKQKSEKAKKRKKKKREKRKKERTNARIMYCGMTNCIKVIAPLSPAILNYTIKHNGGRTKVVLFFILLLLPLFAPRKKWPPPIAGGHNSCGRGTRGAK
jgi:cation transport ATPase